MKQALLFSGQGSQYVGMIKDLAAQFDSVSTLVKRADEVLGYSIGSIAMDGPAEKLTETRYTQPALFVHEAALYDLLKDNLDRNAVAGHSLGEYSALYAAGVIGFEEALKLVSLRGELMFKAGEQVPGTMFAVLGIDDAEVEALCRNLTSAEGVIVAANFNSPGQVVVSGTAEYLRKHAQAFKDAGARKVVELNVSGAFHSPLMQPAKMELEAAINEIEFNDAQCPVYVNSLAQPLTKAAELKTALVQQLVSPVRWTQSIEAMIADGVESFVELGPGKVLQGLVKRIDRSKSIAGFDTAEQVSEKLG